MSSSFLIGSFCSLISVHLCVLGPRPLLKSLFSYIWSYLRNDGLISRSCLLELRNSRVLSMLQRYFLIIKAARTKQALFYAFTDLIRTLSLFSNAVLIKLKISSGIFSPSSNRTWFSSSYQFRVRYWTPIESQWLVIYIPAVLTILWTLFEMINSISWAPYSSQMNKPSLILTTPTRFSSSRMSDSAGLGGSTV